MPAPPSHGRLPNVHRIAVLRANGIGDYVFALPALTALRAAYPGARITLLGAPWHAQFLQGRPGPVDEVVVVPKARGVRLPEYDEEDPAELHRFFREMRARRFDLALQLHGGGKWSNPFVAALGAHTTAGLKAEDAPPLDRWVPYVYWQREVLRYLEAVATVGARGADFVPRLVATECDRLEAEGVAGDLTRRRVAIVNPGASDLRRRWPADRFAAVGDALAEQGLAVVVTGSGEERRLAEEVAETMRAPATLVAGQLSVGGLTGLLAASAIVVTNDTGPLHLAAALGTPTVGIYWCGNIVNAGPMETARHRVLASWRIACPACGVDCMGGSCDHRVSFVDTVEAADVLRAVTDVLAMPHPEPLAAGAERSISRRELEEEKAVGE